MERQDTSKCAKTFTNAILNYYNMIRSVISTVQKYEFKYNSNQVKPQ